MFLFYLVKHFVCHLFVERVEIQLSFDLHYSQNKIGDKKSGSSFLMTTDIMSYYRIALHTMRHKKPDDSAEIRQSQLMPPSNFQLWIT